MRSFFERFLLSMRDDWRQGLVMVIVLLFAQILLRWLLNRRSRPADRAVVLDPWLFIFSLGLFLLVRHLHNDLWNSVIIAIGMVAGGLFTSRGGGRTPWIPMLILAALLGFGIYLSALAFLVAASLVLILNAPYSSR